MSLPLKIFPGLTWRGVSSPAVLELLTAFNLEALDALGGIPEQAVAWGDIGVGVTGGFTIGQAAIPISLTPLLAFTPFTGERKYKQVTVGRVVTQISAQDLSMEWQLELMKSAAAGAYNFSGIGASVMAAARVYKCMLLASILSEGFYSATLAGANGANGYAKTIDQPGYTFAGGNALPLFSGGVASDETTIITPKHFVNPMDPNSDRFSNAFYGIGKITDDACARSVTGQMDTGNDVFGQMLTNMNTVPHPTFPNTTFGLEVTDIIGPPSMRIPFWKSAVKALSLELRNPTGSTYVAAATTNAYSAKALEEAGATRLMGPSGLAPWRFWTAPQLASHPYMKANPTKQMWFAVSQSKPGLRYAELAGPTKNFTPKMTLLGDGTEEAIKSRMVRLIGDLDAGGAAGLPHGIQMYTETELAS
jgi:hypothetical protein